MKDFTQKLLSLFLSVGLTCGCVMTASAAKIAYGDVNLDGSIDSVDALAVLEHTVGEKVLDGESFVRADVNGDGLADSEDALDILCYYVGLKAEFDVADAEDEDGEEGTPIDMSADNILALYSDTVKKARNARPEYLFERVSQCTEADVTVKDPLGLLKIAGGVSAKEMEEMTEEKMLAEKDPVKRIMLKGSTNSLVNLPVECTVTDASKLKSISISELEDGNYRIVIKLNDETNPSSNSAVCRVLGVADYNSVVEDIKNEVSIDGAEGLTEAAVDELSYRNAEVICVLNPETKEIVEFNMEADMYMDYTAKVFLGLSTVSIKNVSNTHNISHLSYFSY